MSNIPNIPAFEKQVPSYFLRHLRKKIGQLEVALITDIQAGQMTCSLNGATWSESGVPLMGYTSGMGGGPGECDIPHPMTLALVLRSDARISIIRYLPTMGINSPGIGTLCFSEKANNHTETQHDGYINEGCESPSFRGDSPNDKLTGDYIRYGAGGTFIQLLNASMALFGASRSCQIFCFGPDDYMRLVARNFDIRTDIGETFTYNDEGEVNRVTEISPIFAETLGKDTEEEDIAKEQNEKGKLRLKPKVDKAIGKYRVTMYEGWLGDLIHIFVTRRPEDEKLDDNKHADGPSLGLAEIHLGSDGSLKVRSCSGIYLEKVHRIRVPKKVIEPWENGVTEDGQGGEGDTVKKDYKRTDHKYYKWDESEPGGRSLQELEWRNQEVDKEEVRHFKDHKKDYKVSKEKEYTEPNKLKDQNEGQEREEYKKTCSLIHMRDDGSVYMEDTWGSHIELTQGDIIISAPRDIKLIAGGDISTVAMRDTTIRAHEHVDVVSHSEDVRIKANKNLRLMADRETVSLDAGEKNVALIARKGKVLIRSERDEIFIKSKQKLSLLSTDDNLEFRAKNDISLLTDTGKLRGFFKNKVELQSVESIGLFVGPPAVEPSMSSEVREKSPCGTDVTKDIDENNNGMSIAKSWLFIEESNIELKSSSKIQIDGDSEVKIRGSDSSKLELSGGIHLTTQGDNDIVKENSLKLNQKDGNKKDAEDITERADIITIHSHIYKHSNKETIMDPVGDNIWTNGGTHTPLQKLERQTGIVIGPKADNFKEDFAEGRFRWRDEHREDQRVYEPVWLHKDKRESIHGGEQDWSKLIKQLQQEVPDVGYTRQVQGEDQDCESDESNEQVWPFSKYKEYKDGTCPDDYDTENEKGTFEDKDTLKKVDWVEEIEKEKGRLTQDI